jgi:hypothetical protein
MRGPMRRAVAGVRGERPASDGMQWTLDKSIRWDYDRDVSTTTLLYRRHFSLLCATVAASLSPLTGEVRPHAKGGDVGETCEPEGGT